MRCGLAELATATPTPGRLRSAANAKSMSSAAAAETVVFLVVFFSLSTQASQKFRFLCRILIFSVIAMSSMTRKREYVAMIF